ncbi:MAG: hypothetical protein JWR69_1977, partial [Pedosphaera sp.]|nr:hypothetical protein [Pedosphaera sp.]
ATGPARPGVIQGERPRAGSDSALEMLDAKLSQRKVSNAPLCKTFKEFLLVHARVLQRDGTGGRFSMEGRAPLELVVDWLDKILRNTLDGEAVEIDGVTFAPGQLKASVVAVGGGAQWGKTILELNLMAYATAVRFLSVGNYLPDKSKVEEIVGQKFRPNVLDLYPWMAEMIQVGKVENASGKTIDRKESYTVTDGERKAFGNFCGMHKPPTSITIDLGLLDEVDDIDERNIGYVDARMTNSPVHLTAFIGTQRVAGAGQNARLKASSFHVKQVPCPKCRKEWNLEEEFPRCIRVAKDGQPKQSDPTIKPEMGHDRLATYYIACVECGTPMDRDAGRYVAKHPERIKQARFGVRVSQLNISAISMQEIVGSWYAAFEDPSGAALVAFHCDRIAIPNAGAAQPITQTVLDSARELGVSPAGEISEPYAMSLARSEHPRFAGMDMGPRCWFWCDEVRSPLVSACVWAELIASGNASVRLPLLMNVLGINTVFLDAGGEPDLTKRLVLSLNGLDNYLPPSVPKSELLKMHLGNLGVGLSWDGQRGRWRGIRAAAVLFVAGEARGIEQTLGFTQEGNIYPLIKCNRAESIQTAVNDFLTPNEGVLEMVGAQGIKALRTMRRARLPQTYIGPGVSQAILDGHLLNLRKERDTRTGEEDWVEGVENHLGLSKTYARLSQMVAEAGGAQGKFAYRAVNTGRNSSGLGRRKGTLI